MEHCKSCGIKFCAGLRLVRMASTEKYMTM